MVVGGESSLDTHVLSGVPQDSVLGQPLVYIDNVSDIEANLCTLQSHK